MIQPCCGVHDCKPCITSLLCSPVGFTCWRARRDIQGATVPVSFVDSRREQLNWCHVPYPLCSLCRRVGDTDGTRRQHTHAPVHDLCKSVALVPV